MLSLKSSAGAPGGMAIAVRRVIACAAACTAAAALFAAKPAGAQDVYKCGRGSYSQQPCSARIVRTYDAPVPGKSMETKRREQQRLLAASLRREPGESEADFSLRKRRARLLPEDSAECSRLDTRLPVEQSRIGNPDSSERASAYWALKYSKERYRELRC